MEKLFSFPVQEAERSFGEMIKREQEKSSHQEDMDQQLKKFKAALGQMSSINKKVIHLTVTF